MSMTQTQSTEANHTDADFEAVIATYATGRLVRMVKDGRRYRTADVRPDQVADFEARGYRKA